MTKKIPEKYRVWIEARKKYKLSHAHIQMARELGMKATSLRKLASHKQQSWKVPLSEFIEDRYFRAFKKIQPDTTISIEELYKSKIERKEKIKTENSSQ